MFNKNKKYGVLGLARSGIAAAIKIKELGGTAFLSEQKTEAEISDISNLKEAFECEFGGHSEKLLQCDEWIISPGIPLASEIVKLGKVHNIKMISELEFGYQIKSSDSVVIAVTGSNGKSTTASLIAHIMKKSGNNCILAGNIGNAICEFPIEKPGIDVIVLEVSSFQLDLIDTFAPQIGLVLNITPDHLDRYDSFRDYALSKMKMFKNQTSQDHAILNMDDVVIEGLENFVHSQKHYFSINEINKMRNIPDVWLIDNNIEFNNGTTKINVSDLQIKGSHNWANAMAAIIACTIRCIKDDAIIEGLKDFPPLMHRLQYVKTINNVSFFNDSKATNTDSVKYALNTFEKPIRIIMGGSDKGEDFSVLTSLLQKRTKKVYITGDTSQKMMKAWEGYLNILAVEDFEQCVLKAYEDSVEGDIVVLSPACASYDRFQNYEHRGITFINIVKKIAEEYEKK